jgi:hypothetical protein
VLSQSATKDIEGCGLTFLENGGSVHTHDSLIGVFILFTVTHDGLGTLPSFMNYKERRCFKAVRGYELLEVVTLPIPHVGGTIKRAERKVLAGRGAASHWTAFNPIFQEMVSSLEDGTWKVRSSERR